MPDNPNGSGDDMLTVEIGGEEYHIPYHYQHLGPDSEWEVVTVIPYAGDTPEHLNTYRVPGNIVGAFVLDMTDPQIAEFVLSVRLIGEDE